MTMRAALGSIGERAHKPANEEDGEEVWMTPSRDPELAGSKSRAVHESGIRVIVRGDQNDDLRDDETDRGLR